MINRIIRIHSSNISHSTFGYIKFQLVYTERSRSAPRAGLEPATLRLTGGRSTIELPRNVKRSSHVRRGGMMGKLYHKNEAYSR